MGLHYTKIDLLPGGAVIAQSCEAYIPWYHRTVSTIGRKYTKETVQYTDSKEIKTTFHSILCRFLSALLKIYWQISISDFDFFPNETAENHPPTKGNYLRLKKTVTFCDDPLSVTNYSIF